MVNLSQFLTSDPKKQGRLGGERNKVKRCAPPGRQRKFGTVRGRDVKTTTKASPPPPQLGGRKSNNDKGKCFLGGFPSTATSSPHQLWVVDASLGPGCWAQLRQKSPAASRHAPSMGLSLRWRKLRPLWFRLNPKRWSPPKKTDMFYIFFAGGDLFFSGLILSETKDTSLLVLGSP